MPLIGSIPAKFPLVWAVNASPSFVRTVPSPSQINITPGAASFNDGFPPLNATPPTAGGIPPFIQDMNGALKAVTAWLQWMQAGGPIQYDAAFAASAGGYPLGAVLQATGVLGYYWINTVDGNATNPDTGGAGWTPLNLLGTNSTGDVKLSFKTVADPGYVLMNDGTIGNASSNATTLASAATKALFTLLYNNVVDSWAPILTSGGGATTRLAQGSATVAYANNCQLKLPLALGRAIAISGAGVSLTSRALGQNLGEETHTLAVGEVPSLTISPATFAQVAQAGNTAELTLVNDRGGSVPTSGGGGAHNNMQPSSFMTAMIAL